MGTNTTRRDILRFGTSAAAYAAGAAIVTGRAALASQAKGEAGTSPELLRLIAAVEPLREAVDRHQRDVLDRPAFARESKDVRWQQVQDNNDLNSAWADAQDAVAYHPVSTVTDLHAKLAFMVEHEIGDGRDWLPELLADAARLAGRG